MTARIIQEQQWTKAAAASFQYSPEYLKKYGPAAAGLAGGAALGGATGGWGGALGLGALAGGLGLAYGLTPGKDFGEKWNNIKGYWNKFQNGGFGSLAKRLGAQYALDNPAQRQEFTMEAGKAVRDAATSAQQPWYKRKLADWLLPSAEAIGQQIDSGAVRKLKGMTQVKQGSLAEAFCKEATPLGVSALSPRLATVWNKIAPDSLTVPAGENQPAPLPQQAPAQHKVEPAVKGWPVADPPPYTAPTGPQQRFDPHPVREGRFDYWGKSMVPRR